MGKYHEASAGLELAALEKDAGAVVAKAEVMLDNIAQIANYREAPLFAHMEFREVQETFTEKLRENLRDNFRDSESFGFLKDDKRWQALIKL